MICRSILVGCKTLVVAACLVCLMVPAGGTGARAAMPSAGAPIVIGASLSLSGDYVADGQAFQQGYQLWVDAINQAGGLLGRPVKLIILSDDSSTSQVVANYRKLITVDHADLLFGPFSSLLTIPASVVANRYGYAFVEGAGGGPSVFTRGLHNLFDASLSVANLLTSFGHYIVSLPPSIRPKTAAYATEDDPFTQPQIAIVRAILEKGGIHTVNYSVYPANTTNYTPIADAVIRSHAQVTVCGTLLPDIAAFMQRFRQQNYNPEALIATAGPDTGSQFVKAVGLQNTEGVFVPNGWYPEVSAFGNAAMVRAYLAKYGGTVDGISADVAEAYSVGQVVAQAVTKTRGLDNTKLIKELHSGTFDSVQGPVKFDTMGQNVAAQAYLFQWQNGILLPVFPLSVAAAPPEFPKPRWQ